MMEAPDVLLAHEYLDLKWPWLKEFIDKGYQDVLELVTLRVSARCGTPA